MMGIGNMVMGCGVRVAIVLALCAGGSTKGERGQGRVICSHCGVCVRVRCEIGSKIIFTYRVTRFHLRFSGIRSLK